MCVTRSVNMEDSSKQANKKRIKNMENSYAKRIQWGLILGIICGISCGL
jgi:hypothetical protein